MAKAIKWLHNVSQGVETIWIKETISHKIQDTNHQPLITNYYLRPMIKRILLAATLIGVMLACVDPVEPDFQFEEDFYLIEGQITDQPGGSEVRISSSGIIFDVLTLNPVNAAAVSSIDGAGNEVTWVQVAPDEAAYQPPAEFVAVPGREYYLRVVLPDGQIVESDPEIAPARVPIADPEFRFEQEAYFSDARSRFVPAWRLLVNLDDPVDQENYYQWRFQYWEDLDVCLSCERSALRNGTCQPTPNSRFTTFDYLCDVPCWVNIKGNSLNILNDRFSQGQRIENIEAGRIDFIRRGGLLVAVEQYNLTEKAFDYFSVLNDLATGTGGLNATLPAPLSGNVRTVDNTGEIPVLGYVAVAGMDETRIYLDRDTFSGGQPIPFDASINLEDDFLPEPPRAPCEGKDRTPVKPTGWPE